MEVAGEKSAASANKDEATYRTEGVVIKNHKGTTMRSIPVGMDGQLFF